MSVVLFVLDFIGTVVIRWQLLAFARPMNNFNLETLWLCSTSITLEESFRVPPPLQFKIVGIVIQENCIKAYYQVIIDSFVDMFEPPFLDGTYSSLVDNC